MSESTSSANSTTILNDTFNPKPGVPYARVDNLEFATRDEFRAWATAEMEAGNVISATIANAPREDRIKSFVMDLVRDGIDDAAEEIVSRIDSGDFTMKEALTAIAASINDLDADDVVSDIVENHFN
ncbi:hypothetical protein H2C43_08095 [Corynebacterium glutamicum]|uniref:Uncharacterized protein n=1 Tax=Corynebacterium glutamicum (strain ATCC 13032 / DSM 20300 / JCM 1318 / BCRC 11384 / CCUG 27702 / LMG 3730 / NBRC 12168 / NCIMB 10025 / NRRL B-2784 / 534) TaxID=196627 RepID=Q8NPP4_CORGL|nr:hypothetical protein [Corynebacterium glutamicum]ARV64126.1 hypothetical protein B7P23_04045 [Corynebacterium glutamicum]AUI01250.1 hypothetical protein CYL77_08935 [Corynebacterium glutamicum]AUI04900.1 hypothetical protein C0I99_12630 [Corynebacterium glutamicum]MBA4570606.1 hypothetical protein [Corynebacterium glutamicum]MBA4573463.1 hypothetical protein [Corynebacterium glutamicum]